MFQGDAIETTGNGSVGLVFIDKTSFSYLRVEKWYLMNGLDPSTGNQHDTDMLKSFVYKGEQKLGLMLCNLNTSCHMG